MKDGIFDTTNRFERQDYIHRKVAKCTPQGGLSMTSDVFEEATCEQQFDVDYMKEGKEKDRGLFAILRWADNKGILQFGR